jgi:hypothetical protein
MVSEAIAPASTRCNPPRFLSASCLTQQEVFNHELAISTGKRRTANTAMHFIGEALRSGFDFDSLIQRLAVRTREGIERTRPSHVTPPNIKPFLEKFYVAPNRCAIVM